VTTAPHPTGPHPTDPHATGPHPTGPHPAGKVSRDPTTVPPTAVKTYSSVDTARFKCWGSGVANERTARRLLGDAVPQVVDVWADGEAEYARLEWLDGRPLDLGAPADLVAAGRLLGAVHACTGTWWGSLDGAHRFGDQRAAFASRFQAGVRLLAGHEPALAARVEGWSAPRLAAAGWRGEPRLVHGDFGPNNLLRCGAVVRVLDWEHARWGHPLEDWAKIRFAARFPEPNGFGAQQAALDLLAQGWTAVRGAPPPSAEPEGQLLEAYLAMCLGTFFPARPNPRLQWLADLVGR